MFAVGSIHLRVLTIGLLCLTNMFIQASETSLQADGIPRFSLPYRIPSKEAMQTYRIITDDVLSSKMDNGYPKL